MDFWGFSCSSMGKHVSPEFPRRPSPGSLVLSRRSSGASRKAEGRGDARLRRKSLQRGRSPTHLHGNLPEKIVPRLGAEAKPPPSRGASWPLAASFAAVFVGPPPRRRECPSP